LWLLQQAKSRRKDLVVPVGVGDLSPFMREQADLLAIFLELAVSEPIARKL
jgi:hypothetical protein